MRTQRFKKDFSMKITTEFIKLDQFLKLCDFVSSGGEAKLVIAEELVKLNGEIETRRGKKLFKGDKVEFDGKSEVVE